MTSTPFVFLIAIIFTIFLCTTIDYTRFATYPAPPAYTYLFDYEDGLFLEDDDDL